LYTVVAYASSLYSVPQDHLLWSNRSHAYSSLDRNKEALEDAEVVLKLRPDWPKVQAHLFPLQFYFKYIKV